MSDDGLDPLAGLDPLGHADHITGTERERVLMQRQINALLLSDRLLAQQMAELAGRVSKVEAMQQTTTEQVALMRRELAENTDVTTQVRDLLTAGRVVKRFGDGIGWLAKIGAAGALLWAAILAALHIKTPN